MKILYLATVIIKDKSKNKPCHYFEFWPEKMTRFRVIDTFNIPFITKFEKNRLKFYIVQGIAAFFYQWFFDVVISNTSQSGLVLGFLGSLFGVKKPPLIVFDMESFGRKKRELL